MKVKFTCDVKGFAVWPDIELKRQPDGEFYDPMCEVRGSENLPQLLHILGIEPPERGQIVTVSIGEK